MMMRIRAWQGLRRFPIYGILLFFLIIVLFPLYWMIVTSLRPEREVYAQTPMLLPKEVILQNYRDLIYKTKFPKFFVNSTIVAISTTFFVLIISCLGAYSLARLRFPGKRQIAKSILFTYLIPSSLLFIPLFVVIQRLRLGNTLYALMVTYPTFMIPFATWLLMGYFRSIPQDMEDAARVDGCSRLGVLFRIVLPLGTPGIIAAAIFSFTLSWNEFLYALVFTSSDAVKTVPVGIAGFILGDVYLWGQMMAASVISSLPVVVLYIFVQRYVVQGLTAGAVKG